MAWLRFSFARISRRWLLGFGEALYYSFPVQLLLLHFQRSQLLLGLWLLIALCFLRAIGNVFGMPYLFLDPEYLDRVWFWSFFLLGAALGIYTAIYQMICYILYSHRFAFLGLLQRPFLKFSMNNSLLPFIFHTLFFIKIAQFQGQQNDILTLYVNLSGYVLGLLLLLFIFYVYLSLTHADIPNYFTKSVDKRLRRLQIGRGQAMRSLKEARRRRHSPRTFLDERLRVHFLSRMPGRYDKQKALEIFNQNHFNTLFLGLLLTLGLLLSGIFRESAYVQLPAAASVLLLFSLLMLLLGAMSYWFRAWSLVIFMLAGLGLNFLVSEGHLRAWNYAFGLDYNTLPAEYTDKRLRDLSTQSRQIVDHDSTKAILRRWRARYPADRPPKMLIVAASGGGLRATLWTMRALQTADSLLNGRLMQHTVLITGASGGMLSAAYYRELYLRREPDKKPPWDSSYLQNSAQDLLNPIIFSLLTNDLFLQPYHFTQQGNRYLYDRGHAFEERLDDNFGHVLDKSLQHYHDNERAARIPMLLLGATLANDGRRLYISAQRVSYMTRNEFIPQKDPLNNQQEPILGVDFGTFFETHGAAKLSFLTALRMNATFPYILPLVRLPSEPPMYVMDAGIFDNYGIIDALKYIHAFRDWIEANTSGVILLEIRDHALGRVLFSAKKTSLLHQLFVPIGGIYANLANMQDLRNHTNFTHVQKALQVPLHSLQLSYAPDSAGTKDPYEASLSWHLTYHEKNSIINNIYKPHNTLALKKLLQLLAPQQDTSFAIQP